VALPVSPVTSSPLLSKKKKKKFPVRLPLLPYLIDPGVPEFVIILIELNKIFHPEVPLVRPVHEVNAPSEPTILVKYIYKIIYFLIFIYLYIYIYFN